MNAAGDKKVWNKIHNAADIHSYRGESLSGMNEIDVLKRTQIL
jgi:hypothetical protein